jgi:hypothetical protein
MIAISEKLATRLGISPTEKLPLVAWPGCYPLAYYSEDMCVFCPDCAERLRDEIVDADVYWEGAAMQCDECNTLIESAYGDPWAETDETLNNGSIENV